MNIKCVIFDWAGTVVDFGSYAPVKAFKDSFEAFNIKVSDKEIREPMGMLKWNHIEAVLKMPNISEQWLSVYGRNWDKNDVDMVYDKSEKTIMSILHNYANLKPYVLETIKMLKQKGIKIGSTTGYTNEMMEVIAPIAEKNGYKPDIWFSPNSVNNFGRPYPYMIFKNLEHLNILSVNEVVKIGDTIADIKEAKNAGVIAIGIIEGSSLMGLSQEEFENMSELEIEKICNNVEKEYFSNGADYVIKNLSELEVLIESL